jgi:hypothetical protein
VSYAAFGLGPSTPPPCGYDVILDPYTGLCHCSEPMVRDPSAPNDCVDPDLLCSGNEVWDDDRRQCVYTLPPVTIPGTKPKTPTVPTGGSAPPRPTESSMGGATSFLAGAAVGGLLLVFARRA